MLPDDAAASTQPESFDIVGKMARLAPGHMPGSLAERLFEEGRQQGFRQGFWQGFWQGLQQAEERARQTLTKQLKRRFQHLPPWVTDMVNQSELDQIDRWFDNLFGARDLEEVFD
ncbi:MAG: hypothetical protein FWD57_08755 [Polyangiaceae bacterium]|nr:hypothetical protein [Polyangiaceae bacterium]